MKQNFFYDSGYLCYKPTQSDIQKATELFRVNYRNNNLNTKTVYNREESRIAGLIGEIAFGHLYENSEYVGKGNCPYDYVIYTPNVNITVDVKCKFRKCPPKPIFEASIYNYQAINKFFGEVGLYAFLSTSEGYNKVWFCGMITKTDLMCDPHTILWKKGQVDPTNGKVFHEDTLSIFYKYLRPFELN